MRREANQRENSRNVCSVVVAWLKWSWSTWYEFFTLIKTLWAMKRESSPYRIYYNSPENFKLQFFSVKCFTYETENIDTQAIEILQGGVVVGMFETVLRWMHLWFTTSKNVPRSKNTLLTRGSMIDTRGWSVSSRGGGAPHANKLRMSRNFLWEVLGRFTFNNIHQRR